MMGISIVNHVMQLFGNGGWMVGSGVDVKAHHLLASRSKQRLTKADL